MQTQNAKNLIKNVKNYTFKYVIKFEFFTNYKNYKLSYKLFDTYKVKRN